MKRFKTVATLLNVSNFCEMQQIPLAYILTNHKDDMTYHLSCFFTLIYKVKLRSLCTFYSLINIYTIH